MLIAILCAPAAALLTQQLVQKFTEIFTESVAWGPLINLATKLTSNSSLFTLIAFGLTTWQFASRAPHRGVEVMACGVAAVGTLFYWALMGAFM